VRADGKMRLSVEQTPFALDGKPAAIFARAAGIRHIAVPLDANRILGLCLIDGNVAGDVAGLTQAVIADAGGTCAPGTRHQFVKDIPRAVGALAADDD